MSEEIKSKAISGVFWQFTTRGLAQAISFGVTIVLARLIAPDEFGVVALAQMVVVLFGVVAEGGMGMSLIQKKETDDLDYNTAFYSNLVANGLIYGLVFLLAPTIASFYKQPLLGELIRVSAAIMPLSALTGVQNAILSKRMDFKELFKISLLSQTISAALGITLAFQGYGSWALVAQIMMASVSTSLLLFWFVGWRPSLQFSVVRFRELFNFAWKKQAGGLIGTFCFQLKGYLIGWRYLSADLAYFNRGESLPDMLLNNVNGTISGVLFPALSKLQGDMQALTRALRRSMMVSNYLLTPLLFGLAAIAPQAIPLIYGDRWEPAVSFMQVACVTASLTVLNTANLQGLLAIGKAGEVLKLEIYKKPVMIAILLGAIFISPLAISLGLLLYSAYVLVVNSQPNKRILHYALRDQLRDVAPAFLLAGTMAVGVYFVGWLIPNPYVALPVQVLLGGLYYVGLSHLFQLEAYTFIKETALAQYSRRFSK